MAFTAYIICVQIGFYFHGLTAYILCVQIVFYFYDLYSP